MNAYQILLLISVLISMFVVGLAFIERSAPKSTYFILLTISIFMYVLGYFFEATAQSAEAAYQALMLQYFGLPYVPLCAFLFIVDYYSIKLKKWLPPLLLVLPVIATLLVFTWPYNGIYYQSLQYVPAPPHPHLVVQGAPFYVAFFVYLCALNLLSLICILREAKKREKGGRKREAIHFAAVCLPFATSILYVVGLTPYGLDITPIALIATSVLIAYSLYRLNLLQILPVAKDRILDDLSDAYIIVDRNGHYLDANAAAKKLFPGFASALFLTPLKKIEGLPEALFQPDIPAKGALVRLEQNGRYYRLTQTKLEKGEKALSYCLMLYDVTETKQLMDELQQLATFDSLTGIYNKETFMQLAGIEFDKVRRNGTSAAALMLDLDHFTRINDLYGHGCGDIVLAATASHLKRRFRQTDLFCRYGGEEFCAFIPNMNRDSALRLAEQLREAMASETFIIGGNEFNVTISIGVALYDPQAHKVLEVLIADADSAMFKAKQQGRNRFVLYRP